MVCCTGCTRWRKHKPPRNDIVLLSVGTSLERWWKSTAGCILTCCKFLFVAEEAETCIISLLALAKMFSTGLIHPTTGIVVVMERHQPPIQRWHSSNCYPKPRFSVRTTHIVPISVIQWAVQLLPLTPQPDSKWWDLSNKIDFNVSNVFYM